MNSDDLSFKTAITRTSPSAPMKRLASDDRIRGIALDYGCGKGLDADTYGMDRYDKHHSPDMPNKLYDTITCNYVLNVIECPETRLSILRDIRSRLRNNSSVAYITVRNDRRALNGTTAIGTWQGLVVLALPVVYRCAGYVTYELRKSDKPSQHAYTE